MIRRARALLALTWAELLAVAVGIVLAGAAWSQSGALVGLVAFGCVAAMAWHLAAAHAYDEVVARMPEGLLRFRLAQRDAVWARRDREAEMRATLRAGQWS